MALSELDRRTSALYTAALRLWYDADTALDVRPADAVPSEKLDITTENGVTITTPTGKPVEPSRPLLWVMAQVTARELIALENKISGV